MQVLGGNSLNRNVVRDLIKIPMSMGVLSVKTVMDLLFISYFIGRSLMSPSPSLSVPFLPG